MEPFITHRGRLALLDWSNINTDLIIPARYLKRVERVGFGPLLFADKRYEANGAPPVDHPEQHGRLLLDFPLNNPALQNATVLVVGRNFGCGSSREHAVWAVMQAGYRAVIAPGKGEGFADIFETNALTNGLLAIELDQADWHSVAEAGRTQPGAAEVTIDLRNQTVTLHDPTHPAGTSSERAFRFEIPDSHRQRLLNGLDAIAETLLGDPAIQEHENRLQEWVIPHC